MTSARAPYLSVRHARTGRVGEGGQLPLGWAGEQTLDITVLEVGLSGVRPSIVVNFTFGDDPASDYSGLCVGQYLPVRKDGLAVLAGEVILTEWTNIATALVVAREWRDGGELVGQTARPLKLNATAQSAIVAHQVGGEEHMIQPLLMVRRQSAAPGSLTVTLAGLAFGNLYEHPRWLFA